VQEVVHDAALAAGQLTREKTGGQLTFPEVIMSRPRFIGTLGAVGCSQEASNTLYEPI
jgi:hypothetical protein